ncbi:MAG: hypothetical protein ABW170_19480 [Candidatus Thiodiazotropha sp. L084R]
MLALYPLWRKARRVYSLTSRLPGTNRLGFQPSLALSECNLRLRPASPHPPVSWSIVAAANGECPRLALFINSL